MTPWLLAFGLVVSDASGVSVQANVADGRASVRFESRVPLGALDVARTGDEVVASVAGRLEGMTPLPPPGSPIRSLFVQQDGERLTVRVLVQAGVGHTIFREARALTVSFDSPTTGSPSTGVSTAPPAAPITAALTPQASVSGDTADLYRRLLPVAPAAVEAADVGAASAAGAGPPDQVHSVQGQGLVLGRVSLRPWLTVGYVNAEYIPPEGGAPQRQQFFQIQPRIDASAPVGAGSLRAGYEPRLRAASSVREIRQTSHIADGSLSLPLGTRTEIVASEHFSHGVLETDEVDPGREYFLDLATFTSNQAHASFAFDVGVNTSLRFVGHLGRVRFAREAGFFDYDSRGAAGQLRRDLTPNLRLGAGFGYDEILAPTRRAAAMSSQGAQVNLEGDIAPLTRGSIGASWTWQRNPAAPPEGQRFSGLTADVKLQRDLGYSATIGLLASRGTHPSGFENDGFFVTTAAQLDLALPLPLAVFFRGGTGYHDNQYRVPVASLGEPRRDRIVHWSVGLGRSISRWGFWRADYRGERRDSNLVLYDHVVHTYVIRVGVGYFEDTQRR